MWVTGEAINNKWGSEYFRNTENSLRHWFGIDMSGHQPKNICDLYGHFDIIVLMGSDMKDNFMKAGKNFTYKHLEVWDYARYMRDDGKFSYAICDGVLNLIWRIKNKNIHV